MNIEIRSVFEIQLPSWIIYAVYSKHNSIATKTFKTHSSITAKNEILCINHPPHVLIIFSIRCLDREGYYCAPSPTLSVRSRVLSWSELREVLMNIKKFLLQFKKQ